MPFDVSHQWITGCMVGIELEDDCCATVLVIDLFILRLCFYRWKF